MRYRIAWFAVLGMFGCGAQDDASRSRGAQPPVEVVSPGGMPEAGKLVEEAVKAVTPPGTKRCLELVSASDFVAAVEACSGALRADPENGEVREALAQAQAEVARAKAAEAAAEAGAALEGMADTDAEAEMDELKQNLPGRLPR